VARTQTRQVKRTGLAALIALVLLVASLPTAPAASAASPDDDPETAAGMRCTQRVVLPDIANVIQAAWSPDNRTVALTWFGRVPSDRNVSGWREDEIIDGLDLRTGLLRPLGVGDKPQWSATGAYLSYWGPNADELRVVHEDRIVARLAPTMPEVRWVGDTLLFVKNKQIYEWSEGFERPLSLFGETIVPRYPRDDLYWSADGVRFSLTRYSSDGDVERWVGLTKTGDAAPLEAEGASYIEWGPSGSVLLLRYPGRLEVRDLDAGGSSTIPIAPGAIHQWSPDGKALLLGRVSATVPAATAFDDFRAVWPGGSRAAASLPNVIGARAFSPNGKLFLGVSRTGRQDTRIEVYRCGAVPPSPGARADPEAGARLQRLAAEPGRFVRPAAGDVSQFLQGFHTGIDVAAPFGSLVVAADDGVVTATGWLVNGGNRVCLQHTIGLETCYFHLSLILVAPGERVARGQPIALIGMTGITTGPHVHLEAKVFGRLVDPLVR